MGFSRPFSKLLVLPWPPSRQPSGHRYLQGHLAQPWWQWRQPALQSSDIKVGTQKKVPESVSLLVPPSALSAWLSALHPSICPLGHFLRHTHSTPVPQVLHWDIVPVTPGEGTEAYKEHSTQEIAELRTPGF